MNNMPETDDFKAWKGRQLENKISTFMNRHQDRILSSDKIKDLFDLYNEWRDFYYSRKLNKNHGLKAFYYLRKFKMFHEDVLNYLLEKMYLSNFEDSKYVSEVLKRFYEISEKYFLVTYVKKWLHCKIKPLGVIRYFLYHSYQTQLLLNGYRLPCMYLYREEKPVEFAVFEADPLLLHELLRYGTLHSYHANYLKRLKRLGFDWNGLKLLILSISLITKLNPDVLPLTDLSLKDKDSEKYQNHVCCCKLLLRDFTHFYFSLHSPRYLQIEKAFRERIKMEDMPRFITKFSYNVAPQLRNHFIEPMELKQSCRQLIRKQLNEKWLLPNAIYDLPIPIILKQYLDLYFD